MLNFQDLENKGVDFQDLETEWVTDCLWWIHLKMVRWSWKYNCGDSGFARMTPSMGVALQRRFGYSDGLVMATVWLWLRVN
jgi:hypothetical protein